MRIGLTLSGGGSRGFAHLGALKALDDLGIKPTIISGSSAGALIGAFYAAGFSPSKISELLLKQSIFGSLKFAFNKFGLFSLIKLEKLLNAYIPENDFQKLNIPLIICATDIKKGEVKYFSDGDLAKAVTASCAIPGIFSPVIIDGKKYVDGGILNNLPIEPILEHSDFRIGINLMPVEKSMPVFSAKDILMKSLLMSVGEQSALKYGMFDLIIQPQNIGHYNGLRLKNANEMFELGYNSTKYELLKLEVNLI